MRPTQPRHRRREACGRWAPGVGIPVKPNLAWGGGGGGGRQFARVGQGRTGVLEDSRHVRIVRTLSCSFQMRNRKKCMFFQNVYTWLGGKVRSFIVCVVSMLHRMLCQKARKRVVCSGRQAGANAVVCPSGNPRGRCRRLGKMYAGIGGVKHADKKVQCVVW